MGEYAEEAWQKQAHGSYEPEPYSPPAASAKEIAARDHVYATLVKRRNPDHAGCRGAPRYDPSVGVMCFCTEVIGPPRTTDLLEPPKRLPQSLVTADAAKAQPVEVPAEERRLKDVHGISSAVHPNDPILSRIEIIDPTLPYDSKMVEVHLLEVVNRLEEGAHYERVCAEDLADKVINYELAYNRKRFEAKKEVGGSEGDREAWARMQVETQYLDREIAKLKFKAIQSTMHSLRSVLSAYQTIAKSIQSAYSGTRNDAPQPF